MTSREGTRPPASTLAELLRRLLWVDSSVGLDDVRVDVVFVRTPDGHGRLELTKFQNR